MAKHKVQFFRGTQEQYNAITPSQYTFYFLTDTKRCFLGTTELSPPVYFGLTRQWQADMTFKGKKGCFYVYTDYIDNGDGSFTPGLKIGEGQDGAYLADLPFIGGTGDASGLQEHINNTYVHIQEGEREKWDRVVDKLDKDSYVNEENLFFIT